MESRAPCHGQGRSSKVLTSLQFHVIIDQQEVLATAVPFSTYWRCQRKEEEMILKIEKIPGGGFSALVQFIDSKESSVAGITFFRDQKVSVHKEGDKPIFKVESATPQSTDGRQGLPNAHGESSWDVTINVRENYGIVTDPASQNHEGKTVPRNLILNLFDVLGLFPEQESEGEKETKKQSGAFRRRLHPINPD